MSLTDIDLSNPDNFVEGVPHHWFKRLRDEAPVHAHPDPDGGVFYNLTKYTDVKHVSRSPKIYSSYRGGTNLMTMDENSLNAVRMIMINMDPPQHTKFRRIVQRVFTPRMIHRLDEHVRAAAKQIVDGVAKKGECEFVEEVAAELPLQVICEMMGVPQDDRSHIFELSNKLIGFDDPEYQNTMRDAETASAEVFAYAMRMAQEFKKNPDGADNLTSRMLFGEVDGEQLTELEFCSFFMILIVAGNETTRTVTVNGMQALMEHPDQLQQLVDDPSGIPLAVEEILRFAPAVHHFRRTTMEPVEIRDVKIPEGSKVLLWYPAANRDEEFFEDPETFNIKRQPNDHLSFGIGEHFCLGASLARSELYSIFDQIITRMRNPEFAGPVRRLRSNFINGVKEMRINFTPEA